MLMQQENKLENNLLENIFNTYEIGLYHKKPPDKTLAAEHLGGKKHARLTVMPSSNAVNLYKVKTN